MRTFVRAAVLPGWGLWVCLTVFSGCGGYYILTVPDHVGAADEEAPVVARLQRNDFLLLGVACPEAAMRFNVGDGPDRAAYTDKIGYAGTTVPAPAAPGRYVLRVSHLDFEGEEVAARVPLYVWDPNRPVAAVDLDCLPGFDEKDADAAQAALRTVGQKANVLYLTRQSVSKHRHAHWGLVAAGYPDGPILLWRRERWHVVRGGRLNLPRVVVESRLVSQLAELRKTFKGLNVGVCRSSLAARAFAEAGLRCVVIGSGDVGVSGAKYLRLWSELAERGL